MDIKGFPALIVGVVVALVLVGACLPAFNDVTTFDATNDYGTMAKAPSSGTEVITASVDTDTNKLVISVDSTDQSDAIVDYRSGVSIPLIYSDMFVVYSLGDMSSIRLGHISDTTGKLVMVTNIKEITITLNDSTATMSYTLNTDSTGTYTHSFNWLFYPYVDGGYSILNKGLITSPVTLYYNDLDNIYGVNWVYSTGDIWFSFHGDTVKYGLSDTITANVNSTEYAQDVNGFSVTSSSTGYTFDVPLDDSTYTVNPAYFIVPYSVSGPVFGATPAIVAIMGILPLLIVAGLVTGAIVWFISRKG